MKLAIVVPVAPFEPEEILLQSVRCLKELEFDGEKKILYVVDRNGKEDRRAELLRREGVEVLERNNTRGKRAGAINDGLKYLRSFKPEFVAIFDVDSKPEKNFLIENVKELIKCEKAYISSSPRRIYNAVNLVSKTVELEYHLLNYLIKKNGYKQFNGLIGVLRAKFLYEYGLNECAITEDADFSTRMHAMGYKAIYCDKSVLHEQSPLSWKEFYYQRKRWYFGGLQLWRYRELVKKSRKEFKYSWYLALTITYIPVLILPFLPILPLLILAKFRNLKKLIAVPGFVVYSLVLQSAALSAVVSYLRKRNVEWKAARRTA